LIKKNTHNYILIITNNEEIQFNNICKLKNAKLI